MGASFRIARIYGVDIEIHISWLLIVGLLGWSLAESVFPETNPGWSRAAYWAVGMTASLLLFATVLVHELAHAIVAIRRGLPVPKITLFIFGGVSAARQPKSACEELAIAFAGPATSFVIAAVCGVIAAFTGSIDKVQAIFAYLALVNVALGVFNLLPGFPLDGGRVLRGFVWERTGSLRRATQVAARVGELFAYGLLIVGALFLVTGYAINGLWMMLIAWFLLTASRGEVASTQLDAVLGKLTAKDVMDPGFATVAPEESLQDVIDHNMIGGPRAVLVGEDGVFEGILSITDVRTRQRDTWPSTTVASAMTPRDRVVAVEAGTKAADVLGLLGERRLNQVPVLAEGRVIGLVSRRELVERIQMFEALAPEESAPPDQ
jgi:Zn-dependent protease/predicted transcriptional regulator